MLRIVSMAVFVGVVFLLSSGCDCKAPTGQSKDGGKQAAAAPKHSPDDGHDHAAEMKGDDHAVAGNDDHADGDDGSGHGHGGERHELGSREVAGFTVEVTQYGAAVDIVAELVFEIEVRGEDAPTAVRLLVRAADNDESLKIKANKVGDHKYDAHVGELPSHLGAGSVLVIELETPSGTKKLEFPLGI